MISWSKCCRNSATASSRRRTERRGCRILQSKQPIALLLTDVGLPGLNGRQLADAAREHRPNLKVLFMTGYVENTLLDKGFLGQDMEVITKPFAFDNLAAKIAAIMPKT